MERKAKIKIEGHLDHKWNDWFEGMELSHEGDDTILSGSVIDESNLHGILNQIRDLNLKLISVNPHEENNNNKQQTFNIMKKFSITLLVCVMAISMSFGQKATQADQLTSDMIFLVNLHRPL